MWDNLEYIASRVQKKVEGGIVTDDSRIDLDVVKDHVHEARAELLGLMKKTMLQLPSVYYQRISCLEVKCEEIVCDGFGSGVYQHYIEIPSIIGAWGKRSIKSVTNATGTVKFLWQESGYSLPYGGKSSGTFYPVGNKLILKFNNCQAKYMAVEGLFSNPYRAIESSGCPNWEIPYPIAGDDIGKISDMVFKRMVPQKQIRHDTKNDAQAT